MQFGDTKKLHWLVLTTGTNLEWCSYFLWLRLPSHLCFPKQFSSCFKLRHWIHVLFLTTRFFVSTFPSLLSLPTVSTLCHPSHPSFPPHNHQILSKTWGRWVMSWETKWLGFVYSLWFFHFLPLDSSLFCTTIFFGNILLARSLGIQESKIRKWLVCRLVNSTNDFPEGFSLVPADWKALFQGLFPGSPNRW